MNWSIVYFLKKIGMKFSENVNWLSVFAITKSVEENG